MWELDCEESCEPKNWCFWTVVLEKTLESPLDCEEIQPVHSKWIQPVHPFWMFFGRKDAKAETLVLWPPHAELTHWKRLWCWKGLGQEEKGTTKDEMARWHHWLDGRESEWPPGFGDGQGGLACCDSWGRKESDTTEWLKWTELNWTELNWTDWTSFALVISALIKPWCLISFTYYLIPFTNILLRTSASMFMRVISL